MSYKSAPDDHLQLAVDELRQAGIRSPIRTANLIREAIARLQLDLRGFTLLTEAASGPFVVTPVIGAMAGAKVIAVTRESRYGSTASVVGQTRALETLCGIPGKVEIKTVRTIDLFKAADIVTNLGFVRPIDGAALDAMKPTSAVSLMCESWEFRPEDLDLSSCRKKGIVVLGTDESETGCKVFSECGTLCMKMLLEAQVPIRKSRIIVVSGDRFGTTIESSLRAAGAIVELVPNLKKMPRDLLESADSMVVADYRREDMILGPQGDLDANMLLQHAPHLTVLQFAGVIDVGALRGNGIDVYPGIDLEPHRMARTLSDLGPRPVIDLHAAGLKVGEALAKARLTHGLDPAAAVDYALKRSPAQPLIEF